MTAVPSRAIRFHQFGEPADVLREDRIEVPDPGAGLVRVRVAAAGLNPADAELCRGFAPGPLPRGIGCDVAGTVDAVGAGVDDVAVGDRVFGSSDVVRQPSAGAADVAILRSWHPVPDGLDSVQAAALPMVVLTARWTLDLMGLGPGTTLLVHGAGGMVGYAAVQIALRAGARVLATAGPTFAGDLARRGALVTPYGEGMADRVRALAGGDVDLVLDTPRPGAGTLPVLIALAGGDPARVVTISNHDEARALGARVNLDELRAGGGLPDDGVLREYAALAAAGEFRIPIAATYPLGAWREAVERSTGGHPGGKLVLLPQVDAPAV
ncbi:NADP-dependent oxidoreductase [Pseudolysinimonas kribbensis]|uniref:NADPH:quinone reductase n=1 Tax=Pseudolysinimonas kribbensis TaxID=433641 RepID=A0ABQ6K1H2_9MICO|nr:NADP-dependent oxidoreductase [Pseudolysinimonas kribbensis]GMA94451.1 NADPH:quinone reductase [Pseudolysinimonas kribbensis]